MLSYSLLPTEIPVTIDGKAYVLREASEAAAVQYRDITINGAKMQDGKVVGVHGISRAEPTLVSLCLFEKGDKGEVAVAFATVASWPARVVKDLFENAKRISHLNEEEETVETLEKQIAALQERLAAKRGGDEGSPKN